jgi:DUF2934 family protein
MSESPTAHEHAIREQAYYFWEQDGRPHGRETEYWIRAVDAVIGAASAGPAKRAAKSGIGAKVKAAASKASTAPAKSAKPSAGKPKKK